MTTDQACQVDATPELMPAALNTEGRISGDLGCITCGYNLRTLHVDGRCPECGADVRASIQVAMETPALLLQDAAVGARGLVTAGSTLAVGIVLVILLVAFGLPDLNADAILFLACVLGTTAVSVALIAGVGGIVGFTVRYSRVREGLTARCLSRWCLLVIALNALIVLFIVITLPWLLGLAWPPILIPVPCLGGIVSAVTMWCALLIHARKLMLRVARPDIALFAGRLSWVVAFGCCTAIVCLVLSALDAQFSLAACLCGLALLGGLSAITAMLFWRVMWALAAARQQMEKYAREFSSSLRNSPRRPAPELDVGS